MFSTDTIPPCPVLAVRADNVPYANLPAEIGRIFGAVYAHAGPRVAGPPFVRYFRVENNTFDIEGGFPVAPGTEGTDDIAACELPGGTVAVCMHVGPYEKLHETWVAMEKWLKDNGHTSASAPWEVYLNDPAQTPPEQLKTQIVWPIG